MAFASPTRRTNGNSRVTPALVEGDIDVPQRHLATGQELSAFLANPPALWPRGVVYYCVETDEDPEGVIEPVFTNEGLNNITQAFSRIMEAVRDTIDQDQLKNQKYLKRFGHTKALLFFQKKGPHFGQNSRPGESDPYIQFWILHRARSSEA